VYLIKVHRILIASSIALCVLYTVRQAWQYASSNAIVDLVRAFVSIVLAAVLGLYFRSIRTP
jgi:hypothetical protein